MSLIRTFSDINRNITNVNNLIMYNNKQYRNLTTYEFKYEPLDEEKKDKALVVTHTVTANEPLKVDFKKDESDSKPKSLLHYDEQINAFYPKTSKPPHKTQDKRDYFFPEKTKVYKSWSIRSPYMYLNNQNILRRVLKNHFGVIHKKSKVNIEEYLDRNPEIDTSPIAFVQDTFCVKT